MEMKVMLLELQQGTLVFQKIGCTLKVGNILYLG